VEAGQVRRVEAEQKQLKNILNSLAAVIRKNKHNAVDSSEKLVHPWSKQYFFNQGTFTSQDARLNILRVQRCSSIVFQTFEI